MTFLKEFDRWPSRSSLLIALVLFLIGTIAFNVWTAKALIDSRYPDEGLLLIFPAWWFTFDAPLLKAHYAILLAQETFATFLRVQYLDFGLMLTTGPLIALLAIGLGRLAGGGLAKSLAYLAALAILASTAMDLVENAVLLVMLSDPEGFPDFLAWLYSAAATLKVIAFLITVLLFLGSLLLMGFARLSRTWANQ